MAAAAAAAAAMTVGRPAAHLVNAGDACSAVCSAWQALWGRGGAAMARMRAMTAPNAPPVHFTSRTAYLSKSGVSTTAERSSSGFPAISKLS